MALRIIAFLLLAMISGCSTVQETGVPTDETGTLPDQVIWDASIEVVDDARLQSVVYAGRVRSWEKERTTLLDSGVVVDFFDRAGRHTSTLTSQRAQIVESQDLFLAEGEVEVVSDSGAVLRTERLYWDQGRQRIRSDTLVVLVSAMDSLRGYDFESNEDLTSWQLEQPTGQTFRRLSP